MTWYEKSKRDIVAPMARVASGAGINRLHYHMTGGEFSVLSAHRGEGLTAEDRAVNNERTRALKKLLRDRKHGFIDTTGAWKDSSTGGDFVKEKSLFVPGIGEQEAREIGGMFDQDAIIVGNEGRARGVFLGKDDNGEEQAPFLDGDVNDMFHYIGRESDPDAIKDASDIYTNIRGKRIVLDPNLRAPKAGVDLSGASRGASVAVRENDMVFYALNGRPPLGLPQQGVLKLASARGIEILNRSGAELVAWVPFLSGISD